ALREICTLLAEETRALSESLRAPLVLCYLEGKTRDEAAGLLGLSLGTLKRRLEQGRERLRLRLARRGVTLSGALLAASLGRRAPPPPTATARAALAFATGRGHAGRAAAWAEAALRALAAARLKASAALLLTLVVLAGVGVAARQQSKETP